MTAIGADVETGGATRSDVHALSIKGPAFDQLVTMSKFLCLGMELTDALRASTTAPAAALGRTDIGSWRSARLAMRPCSNSPKAISNIAMSWARFVRDGNGSKRADWC
jgi:hypothetical protein